MSSWYRALASVLVLCILATIYFVRGQLSSIKSIPSNIPWVGLKHKRILPKLRANLRELSAGRKPISEGYQQYSKNDEAFVLPGLIWPEVVLPPSQTFWIAAQPEQVLSSYAVLDSFLFALDLSDGTDTSFVHDFSVISRNLTRKMGSVLPQILEELRSSFEESLGTEAGAKKEVALLKAITAAVRMAAIRVFFGNDLARDKSFRRSLEIWETTTGTVNYIVLAIPQFLRPWITPIVVLPTRLVIWRVMRFLTPVIRARIAALDAAKGSADRPNDVMQWLIENLRDAGSLDSVSAQQMTGKLMVLNLVAEHTIALTACSTLFNVLCHPDATSILAELNEEASGYMAQPEADTIALRAMVKTDAVVRESLSSGSFACRALNRVVMMPGGVTLPNGLYLPQGVHVSIVVESMLEKGEAKSDFVPFKALSSVNEKQKMAVQINQEYLPFGLGRHACPGRFFAIQTIKTALACLVTGWTIDPLEKRPKGLEMSDFNIPSGKAKVTFWRRTVQKPREPSS